MQKIKELPWLFWLILLLSFGLRFVNLDGNPAGFFRDEADKGYTSYSLMVTGRDQAGNTFPLFVKALSVTTSAVYQYIDIPFIAGLGLNEFAVRLPACLAGTGAVLAAFLLGRLWWGERMGLWAAFFVCFSPWSILLSRWANQSSLLTLFVPLGVYFFVRDRDGFPKPGNALAAIFFFVLALYTYATARLFIPVFVFLLGFVRVEWRGWSSEQKLAYFRKFFLFLTILAILGIPLATHVIFEAESSLRLNRVSIFGFENPVQLFWQNYLAHVSPGFLFISGDANPRHNTAVFGQEHYFLLPLLVPGIIQALVRFTVTDRILLLWFLLFPVPAAMTNESIPHALRSIYAVPVLHLLSVRGIVALGEWQPWWQERITQNLQRIALYGWRALVGVCIFVHLFDFFVRYPVYSAPYWEYGYKEAIAWWQENRREGEPTRVSHISEYPSIFFLFYLKYPPDKGEDGLSQEYTIEFPKFSPQQYYYQGESSTLNLLRPEEMPGIQPEKVIFLPSGEAFWKWVRWEKPKNL